MHITGTHYAYGINYTQVVPRPGVREDVHDYHLLCFERELKRLLKTGNLHIIGSGDGACQTCHSKQKSVWPKH
jgi:hypothetical protein